MGRHPLKRAKPKPLHSAIPKKFVEFLPSNTCVLWVWENTQAYAFPLKINCFTKHKFVRAPGPEPRSIQVLICTS